MAVESAADLAVFVNPDDFGMTARIVPQIGFPVDINGIFDASYQMIEMGQAGVASVAPVFICRSADLAALPMLKAFAGDMNDGDTLQVSGQDYLVTDIQPDGTGMTVLILEKQ